MNRMRFMLSAGMAAVMLLCAGVARADTLNLPISAPDVFVTQVHITYGVASPGIGLLTASGNLSQLYKNNLTTSVVQRGSFALSTYFNTSTGGAFLGGTFNGTDVDPLLQVTDSSNNLLYYSTHLFEFAANLNGTSPATFDFMWRKDGGSLATGSPLPFIGTDLRSITTLTSPASSFKTSLTSGTVFENKKIVLLNAWGGTADVFMTPTPTSVSGGLVLMGAAVVMHGRRKMRQVPVI